MPRGRKRAKDYVRCTGCGRLTERVNARPGPDGGRYGPECISRAVQAVRQDPFTGEMK